MHTMSKHHLLIIICLVTVMLSCDTRGPFHGPLRVSENNPRYFTDNRGDAILLTGAHTWNNLVDMGPSDTPPAFDYYEYLQWMKDFGHNFIRLWTWELTTWNTEGNNPNNRGQEPDIHRVVPLPWLRSGPGEALDGKPKFDLEQFDEEYFNRLGKRIELAGEFGIYVSVMLFEGWGLQFSPGAYESHPFHPDNNINGIKGDLDGDSSAVEIHELRDRRITEIQEDYVRKVIDEVNDFDNVLYEISNEDHTASTAWQYHMINLIHDYESSKSKQHPVGMTFQYKGGSNMDLFNSPAEWISPNHEGGYRDDPPTADGSKVIITDTDHLWGIGGNAAWAWKSFCRGMHPIFMDPYDGLILGKPFDEEWEPIRVSLGYILQFASRMDLNEAMPSNALASTGYCLADPGKEYLVYLPDTVGLSLDLTSEKGLWKVEWFDPGTGTSMTGKPLDGGDIQRLVAPFETEGAVLYLESN